LEASIAYVSGKPIMSDKEFDELKMKLKVCYFHFINEKSYRYNKSIKDTSTLRHKQFGPTIIYEIYIILKCMVFLI
jgi:tartrate dehydratase beta subunit/fumarate hydratase class I family protein